MIRSEWVPFDKVCAEIGDWLKNNDKVDVITFAGSGEPTLYSRLGELIDYLKKKTEIPIVVLSNGTLFNRPDVQNELLMADAVKVSLSAWNSDSFYQINRPTLELTFDLFLAGVCAFRAAYHGELWLEIFLMAGINDRLEQVRNIAAAASKIRPDKIHLNTTVRPPAETIAHPVSKKNLEAFCALFTPPAEVIASFVRSKQKISHGLNNPLALLKLIRRHPVTADQLASVTGTSTKEIVAFLAPFIVNKQLRTETRNKKLFYLQNFSSQPLPSRSRENTRQSH